MARERYALIDMSMAREGFGSLLEIFGFELDCFRNNEECVKLYITREINIFCILACKNHKEEGLRSMISSWY